MKKIIFAFLAGGALMLTSCEKKPGSVSGNVYYKYNDYVGNKPDTGTKIKVYEVDEKAEKPAFETTTDVSGNYKLEGIPPGDYLLILESKNTTATSDDILIELSKNSEEVNKVFGFDVAKYETPLRDAAILELQKTVALEKANGDDFDEYFDKYKKLSDDYKAKIDSIVSSIPDDVKKTFSLYGSFGPKIEVKKVTVSEEKDTQNNTDFGVTYN